MVKSTGQSDRPYAKSTADARRGRRTGTARQPFPFAENRFLECKDALHESSAPPKLEVWLGRRPSRIKLASTGNDTVGHKCFAHLSLIP